MPVERPVRPAAEKEPQHAQPGVSQEQAASATSVESGALKDKLDVVVQNFNWLNDSAQQQIESLRSDIKEQDEPPWSQRLMESLLDVALEAGIMTGAGYLSEQLLEGAGKLGQEFVKELLSGGMKRGLAAGLPALGNGHGGHVVDPFIDSQKDAVRALHKANQADFITRGRHRVETLAQAEALLSACSLANIEHAAHLQYQATRDAWISYLAQTKFGAAGKQREVGPKDINIAPTVTNMETQEQRDRINRSAPAFVPDQAPEFKNAIFGHVPGVLEIIAKLPSINSAGEMDGTPEVGLAYLNGVNEKLRSQYEGNSVASMRIPRQILAKVEGDLPNFKINLDETGRSNYLGPQQGAWLRARATVGHSQNREKNGFEREKDGLALLLAELVPGEIKEEL